MHKEDYILILGHRNTPLTKPAMWALKLEELEKLVGILTPDEVILLKRQSVLRCEYITKTGYKTIKHIEAQMKLLHIAPGNKTKFGMVDEILSYEDNVSAGIIEPEIKIKLDEDQQIAVNSWHEPFLLISAGPGSGKTTTVVNLADNIIKNAPQSRVLILVFNINAQETLIKRLKHMNSTLIPKTHTNNNDVKGIAVLTFHKFGYQVSKNSYKTHMENMIAEAEGIDEDCSNDLSSSAMFDENDSEESINADDEKSTKVEMNSVSESSPSLIHDSNFQENSIALMDLTPVQPDITRGFRIGLEDAVNNIKKSYGVKWDHIIIDEAQDVNHTQASLIEGVRYKCGVKRIMIAGDPRQELYEDSSWFSSLWTNPPENAKKIFLRYNHRSSKIIVDMLNDYSRHNFPTLHHDQIATRDDPGEILAEKFDDKIYKGANKGDDISKDNGIILGNHLANYDPGKTYAIAPVTVRKCKLHIVSNQIRETIYRRRGAALALVLYDDADTGEVKTPTNIYEIGTAKKLKGTEREQVIIFGLNRKYSSFIKESTMKKLIFVSLSRARDKIVFVNNIEIEIMHIISPIYKYIKEEASVFGSFQQDSSPESYIVYASDLACKLEHKCKTSEAIFPSPVKIDIEAKNDHDFIGVAAECALAVNLGINFTNISNEIEVLMKLSLDKQGIFFDKKKQIFRVQVNHESNEEFILAIRKHIDKIKSADNKFQQAYEFAVLKFSLDINMEWTMSERLSEDLHDFSRPADFLRKLFKTNDFNYHCRQHSQLKPSRVHLRCSRTTGDGVKEEYRAFEPDFIVMTDSADIPIEIKFCSSMNDNHRRQASIYATMCKAPKALLYNIKLGKAEWIYPYDGNIYQISRSIISLMKTNESQLRFLKMIRVGHIKSNRKILKCNKMGPFISVDMETDYDGNVTEIGAVIFNSDRTIYDSFHEVGQGVKELITIADDCNFHEKLTGLQVTNKADLVVNQDQLIAKFHEWINSISGFRTFIHWGGNESKILPEHLGEKIDAYKYYKAYINGERADGLGLFNAIQDVCTKVNFAHHRAFDDALATMSVFMAITDFSGTV